MLTGIIIAGGQSKRMGFDKTQIVYQNLTFMDRAVQLLTTVTSEIIISSNQPQSEYPYPVIKDKYPNIGPIGGLVSCLPLIKTEYAIILPVDLPLFSGELIQKLIQSSDLTKQINILSIDGRPQMLTGIYHKSVQTLIEKQIEKKDYTLRHLLNTATYKMIDATTYRHYFFNVNRPENLKILKNEYEK